ncbi:MAG: sugar kinase [Clostridia bacterium]|nr:sugar kinase [Clostridia bacterium]
MKAVTLGEFLLRLSPRGDERLVQSEQFEAVYGGGEANVAVSLACFGINAAFVTKLPAHEIGQSAVNSLRRFGVDTSEIVRGGDRMGIYFFEKGAGQRAGKVIYDRKNSAFALSEPNEYDWKRILDGANRLHVSGITPALSENAAEITREAMAAAKKAGVKISFDPNYRSSLWDKETAAKVLKPLCRMADVLITNAGQGADIFGVKFERDQDLAAYLNKEYGCEIIALSQRITHTAQLQEYGAMLYCGGKVYEEPLKEMYVSERIGGGDAFAAGLIYALMNGYEPQKTISFAVAAARIKHTVRGDCNLASVREVEDFARGDSLGAIRR